MSKQLPYYHVQAKTGKTVSLDMHCSSTFLTKGINIFSYFSIQTNVVGIHQKFPTKTHLMRTHNMFSWRTKKNTSTVWFKKLPYLEHVSQTVVQMESPSCISLFITAHVQLS